MNPSVNSYNRNPSNSIQPNQDLSTGVECKKIILTDIKERISKNICFMFKCDGAIKDKLNDINTRIQERINCKSLLRADIIEFRASLE
jgi:hypothetical protein